MGLVRVSRKRGPSVLGSSVVNLICRSMELRCCHQFSSVHQPRLKNELDSFKNVSKKQF